MRDMYELIDRLMNWFDDVQRLSPETAMQLMGMGTAVTRLLDLKDRITGGKGRAKADDTRSEEHTSELQSQSNLVCRLLLEKKKINFLNREAHRHQHC